MRRLSPAIVGIPRPYLRNRCEGLIFCVVAERSLAAMDFAGRTAVARPFLANGRPLDF